jgi:TMEM175 potassium channel family protein
MKRGRLEAFSDGVIAIIITIMVLELKVPHGTQFADIRPILPVFLSYVLSFVFVGIYWNNHHHLIHLVQRATGKILWANLYLLFWMSLIPFTTGWLGENHNDALPTALYGAVLLMAGIAYLILQNIILAQPSTDPKVVAAFRQDRKGPISALLYASAVGFAFVYTAISDVIYVVVAALWLIPDRRIERVLAETE